MNIRVLFKLWFIIWQRIKYFFTGFWTVGDFYFKKSFYKKTCGFLSLFFSPEFTCLFVPLFQHWTPHLKKKNLNNIVVVILFQVFIREFYLWCDNLHTENNPYFLLCLPLNGVAVSECPHFTYFFCFQSQINFFFYFVFVGFWIRNKFCQDATRVIEINGFFVYILLALLSTTLHCCNI